MTMTYELNHQDFEKAQELVIDAISENRAAEFYNSKEWEAISWKYSHTGFELELRELRKTLVKAVRIEMDDAELIPHVSDKIEKGAIMYSSWGYEQTNIDYYVVVRRTKSTAWYVPVTRNREATSMMTAKEMPGATIQWEKGIIRRKIYSYGGKEQGVNGPESFMSLSLWEGRALASSSYH